MKKEEMEKELKNESDDKLVGKLTEIRKTLETLKKESGDL